LKVPTPPLAEFDEIIFVDAPVDIILWALHPIIL